MNIKKLNDYYNLAKKHVTVDEKGHSMTGEHIELFEGMQELILLQLKIPNQNNLTVRGAFRTELINSIRNKVKTVDWAKFKDSVQNRVASTHKKKFEIGFGIPIALDTKAKFPFQRLSISDFSINKITQEHFRTKFDIELIADHYKMTLGREKTYMALSKFEYFIARVEAASERNAIEVFNRNYEFVKSLINSSNYWMTYTSHWIGGKKQHSAIIDPDVYVLKNIEEDKTEPLFDFYPTYTTKPDGKLKRDITRVYIYRFGIKVLKKSESQRTAIENLILSCFQLYDSALAARNRRDAFLNYWRILEYATNSIDRKNNEVIKLIVPYFQRIPELQLFSELLVSKRNDLVHRGEFFEYSDSALNWMKRYAEASIDLLFWLHKRRYQSLADIDAFYSVYTHTDKELARKGRIIDQLMKSK